MQKIKLVDKKKTKSSAVQTLPDNIKIPYQKAKNIYTKSTEKNKSAEEYSNDMLDDIVSENTDVAKTNAKKTAIKTITKNKNKKQHLQSEISITQSTIPNDNTVVIKAKNSTISRAVKERATSVQTIGQTFKNTFMPFISKGVMKVKTGFTSGTTLIYSLIAGGSVVTVLILVICIIGLVSGSSYGIFMATGDTGTGYTLQSAVQIINQEYLDEIEKIKNEVSHDYVEEPTEQPNWKGILAVYAVLTTTAQDGNEVATIDEDKVDLMRNVFWNMTNITFTIEHYDDKTIVEVIDEEGNITEQEIFVEKTRVIVVTNVVPVSEIAVAYNFNHNQMQQLYELIDNKNKELWSFIDDLEM